LVKNLETDVDNFLQLLTVVLLIGLIDGLIKLYTQLR